MNQKSQYEGANTATLAQPATGVAAPTADVKETGGASPRLDVATPNPHALATCRRLKKRDIANLTAQLGLMTRSGIDVATSLQSLARQSRKPAVRDALADIHQQVLGGKSFSQALQPYQPAFGRTYVASVAAGEASGRMSDVLNHLAQLLRSELTLRSTIRTLMAYPVLLMGVSSLVILGLVLFVLPQFAEVFEQYEMPLPALTQLLIGVSTELRTRFWLWGPVGLLPFAGIAFLRFSASGKKFCDTLILKAFILRDVTRVLLMGRICRLLGLMLDSGVPLLESLRLARHAVKNRQFQELFEQLEDDVVNGRGMSQTLSECPFLPDTATDSLITAEQTGNMGSVTQLLGEYLEQEGERKLREIVAVAEPVITVGMGVVVAFVVLAVMLPMFDLTTFAQGG